MVLNCGFLEVRLMEVAQIKITNIFHNARGQECSRNMEITVPIDDLNDWNKLKAIIKDSIETYHEYKVWGSD